MTTHYLQPQIDDTARSIAAFNDSEHTWEDCPQEPVHRKGRYCEHQVVALANHLTRNQVQREDAQKQALVKALKKMDEALNRVGEDINAGWLLSVVQAALKGGLAP